MWPWFSNSLPPAGLLLWIGGLPEGALSRPFCWILLLYLGIYPDGGLLIDDLVREAVAVILGFENWEEELFFMGILSSLGSTFEYLL